MRGICLSKENALFFWYCAETHEQRLQQACTRNRADRPVRKSPGTPEIAYFRHSRDFSRGPCRVQAGSQSPAGCKDVVRMYFGNIFCAVWMGFL